MAPVATATPIASDDPLAMLQQARELPAGADSTRLRLTAAQAFHAQGAMEQVLEALAPLNADQLDEAQANQLASLNAKAWLALGDPVRAEAALAGRSRWEAADYLLLGDICAALERYGCAADGYIQASIATPRPSLPTDLNDRIWQALSMARAAPEMFANPDHHAWWDLRDQLRSTHSVTAQRQAWRRWRADHPGHPAGQQPPEALSRLDTYRAPHIGLMLPLRDSFAGAGKALRDGFIAAYLNEAASERPRVRIYDTGEADLAQLWERALSDGVEVMVGPLLKPDVERFVELTRASTVPRLVLNYLPTTEGPDLPADSALAPAPLRAPLRAPLFQLGIAIEDEATSLARHVLEGGHQKVLLVHSSDTWSTRAMHAFRDSWPYPAAAAHFETIKGLTEAVGEAMDVASSQARHDEIQNVLGQQLEFLPRARGDLDAVVALTTNVESRALVPALRFHFADGLPVYATSQSARGGDSDTIGAFNLTEMPVLASSDPALAELRDAFNLQSAPFAALYALGFDAYQVATWLPIIQRDRQVGMAAASGHLRLDANGQFRRELELSKAGGGGNVAGAGAL